MTALAQSNMCTFPSTLTLCASTVLNFCHSQIRLRLVKLQKRSAYNRGM